MINYISVEGFKSLRNFRLRLKSGLNVLIGPNGAGKSNICQALSMISSIAEDNLADYIISLGGIGSIFSKSCNEENISDKTKRIEVKCKGETVDRKISLKYFYKFTLELKKRLIIKNELIKIYTLDSKNKYVLVIKARRIGKKMRLEIVKPKLAGALSEATKGKEPIRSEIPRSDLESIIPLLPIFSLYCHLVRNDIRFAKAWNIDPHLAKKSSDLLESNIMLQDGRHLSNTLYALKDRKPRTMEDLGEIMSYILPSFKKVNVETSKENLTRSFSITDVNGIKYPASCLSDGTVKALALIIGVTRQRYNTSIIEEPENYLHPWAAQSLIEFFREYFTDGACIMTTHSETVLNSLKPKEIVVIENIEGTTKAKRIAKDANLAKAIKNSGFGPGYHYVAGSIGGVPY